AHQAWYGGWTVYASGEHFAEAGEFSAVGKAPNLAARSTRLAGLLIDRRFGLVPWQPAWLLAPVALVALIRRGGDRPALVLPLAAGWLFAVFAAVTMHGWWWPGRHALVVLPLAVIAICCWAGSSRVPLVAFSAAAAAGLWNYVWTAVEGLRGEITWAVGFFDTGNPLYRLYAGVFPDYTQRGSSKWVLHLAWVAVLVASAAWTAARRRPPEAASAGRPAPAATR
ncbi:MAG: hypothetical protein ACRDIU_01450, partial [Actinomycetota bacterium]